MIMKNNENYLKGIDDNGIEAGLTIEGQLVGVMATFRLQEDYEGEFGFDWIRDEWHDKSAFPYLYDEENNLLLEKESTYEIDNINGVKYNIPSLAIYKNHKERTGKDVALSLEVHIKDKYWMNKGELTLYCPDGISVDTESIDLKKCTKTQNDNKSEWILKTAVTITCSNIHNGCYLTIFINDKEKNFNKRRESTEIGRLKFLPNNDILNLNVRLVSFIRKRHQEEDRKYFNERLGKIENYLKNRSFNQGFIDVNIENKEIEFDDEENKHVITKGGCVFVLNTNSLKEECVKNHLINDITENKTPKNNSNKFNGVVVALTSMLSEGSSGFGEFFDPADNYCAIFGGGLSPIDIWGEPNGVYNSIAHEIGHVLGLDHTFESSYDRFAAWIGPNEIGNYTIEYKVNELLEKEQELISEMDTFIKKYEQNIIDAEKDEIRYSKIQSTKNVEIAKENKKTGSENKKLTIKEKDCLIRTIQAYKDRLHYTFAKTCTKNIMDYYEIESGKDGKKYGIERKEDLMMFFFWQLNKIARDRIKKHFT